MAKPVKKPVKKSVKKPAPKTATKKPLAAKAKKPVKSAGHASSKAPRKGQEAPSKKKGLAKSVVSVVGKLLGATKSDAKAQKSSAPLEVKVKTPKEGGVGGKKKKDKKAGKEEFDLAEDDLLAADEEMGLEEIPDLSEFEETEAEDVAEGADEDGIDESSVVAEAKAGDDEIVLTDAEGRRYCRVRDCDQISAVEGYCRYHYLLLWKKIQVRRKILADGKLERYVDELTSRYPDKFLEMIRKDLRTEKDFLGAIAELEIDESAVDNEFEDEAQSYVDEIRGMSTDSGMSEEEEF
jgi:hypothetical protein